MAVLVIGEHDVHALLPMHACIDIMERTFRELRADGFVQPPRIIAWQPDRDGAIAAMPAWLARPHALGAKLISVFPQNRAAGFDSHQGLVALFEPAHGSLRALLHAGAITAIRTAAVSGVATRVLAREDAASLAILGSGVQARMHLEAMIAVRRIRRLRIWSRTAAHAARFANEAREGFSIEVSLSDTAQEAVEDGDLICTVTASTSPVLKGSWLKAGAHVNAVGSSVPPFRELDTDAVVRARLYVDSRESALREPDDVRIPIAEGAIEERHVLGDLAQLAAGACAGRTCERDITIFKSVGLAIEDVAAAQAVYERALGEGRGTLVDL